MALSCIKVATAGFVLAVLAAGILAVRLNQGPIAIDGLGQKIAGALHDRFGKGLQFALGETALVQRGFGPSLGIEKLSVKGPSGESVLEAPHAEVSVDPFALMVGKVVPKRLEVFDVTLRLLLKKNGNLALAAENGSQTFVEIGGSPETGVQPAAVESGSPPRDAPDDAAPHTHRAIAMTKAAEAIRQFIDILTDPKSPVAAVDRLGVSRGTLIIDDEDTEDRTTYKSLDLGFDKAHGDSTFSLSAEGPNGRWHVTASAKGRPGEDRRFSMKAADLTIDELRLAAGSRSSAVDTDMPFGAHVDIGLKADNTLGEVSGGVDIGPGYLRFDDPDMEPMFVTAITGTFHWNPVKRQIDIDSIRYVENDTHFTVGGQIMPPLNEGEPWRIGLALSEPGLLAIDRKGQQPIPIEQGQFVGRLMLGEQMFVIDRFAFKAKQGGVAIAGEADWKNGRHIRIGASMDPTPVQVVKRVWPNLMASAVRAWIINHFEDGLVTGGTLKVDYDENALKRMRADRSPPDQSIAIDFKLSNGRLRYLDGVPSLENVEGYAHISGRTSHFVVTSGTTNADGRTLQLTDGHFTVPNANRHPTPANLSAHLTGDVDAVTNILARDALKPYASVPLDPSTLHGKVDGLLEKALTLGKNADHSRDELKVKAQVTDFVAERLIGKENLDDATLSIVVGGGTLKATGHGQLFGGPVAFEIDRKGTVEPPTAMLDITLDDEARAKLGLNAVSGLTGPVAAHINAVLGDPAKMKAQVELDLAKASVAAAYLGLNKPAGKAGKVVFSLAAGEERMLIDPITFDVGGLQGRGSIDLAPDNSFKGAHFTSFKVSPGDDMKVDVVKGDSAFRLSIRGATIDARPFLKALTSTPKDDATALSRSARAEKKEADSFKGFDIDLKAGLLTGFNKEVMSNVDLKLSKRASQFSKFAVQGRFGREAVSGSMGANQKLRITTSDAGALVSFIDLYKHMESGALNANMKMGEDTLDGSLEIRDFILRDEPAIRRLVATSATLSAPGDSDAARRIDAGAVGFKRLKVNFERAGSRLQLSDATMYGSEIGLSVDGWLDYSHDRVSMKGTFVPAYALNNLFSQIPVFGLFLGGKSNEGLFAITFNISGLASSPTLGINPLSSIAPGFLRQIFGVLDTPGQAPPDASR